LLLQQTYTENKKWESKASMDDYYEKNDQKKGGAKLLSVAIVKKTTKEQGGISFPSVVVTTSIHQNKMGGTLLPPWLV